MADRFKLAVIAAFTIAALGVVSYLGFGLSLGAMGLLAITGNLTTNMAIALSVTAVTSMAAIGLFFRPKFG